MGIIIGLGRLTGFYVYDTVISGITLALFVIFILVLSWQRGWPLWSASWYFYGTWVTLMVIGIIIEN